MPEEAPFVELLVAFGHELRDDGLAVGSGDVLTYCAAVATLDPTDLVDLYWAGRTTMVTRRDQSRSTTGCSGGSSSGRRAPARARAR